MKAYSANEGRNVNMRKLFLLYGTIFLILLSGCAQNKIQLGTIPQPPATNKLRVFLYPYTQDAVKTKNSEADYIRNTYRIVGNHLARTGVYDVIPIEDVQAVLGTERLPEWQIEQDDWSLLKQAAKVLYADYIIIANRGARATTRFHYVRVINPENGMQFEQYGYFSPTHNTTNADLRRIYQRVIRTVLYSAREDMLASAIKKYQTITGRESLPKTVVAKKDAPRQPGPTPAGAAKGKEGVRAADILFTAPDKKAADAAKTKVVVYDLNAPADLNVVALILSEVLREELFLIGKYDLVNREDISRVMNEYKLQQSGLTEEKNAAKLGKWLAVQESVTGQLALLGSSFVLSAKRTEIESMKVLGMGSIRCSAGKEDFLLQEMPALAKRLAEQQGRK